MDIIFKNPYRYLGVYSNSPVKERVANKAKITAFAKVGKPVSFPLDLPNVLPPISRTTELVAEAEARLTLPADQVRYAQFWWMKATPLDEVAFNHLLAGNMDMARSIWEKKDNASSLQNRLLIAAIRKDYTAVLQLAERLYAGFSDAFEREIIGEAKLSTPLWQTFIDTLLEAEKIVPSQMSNPEWKRYVVEKTVDPLINAISSAIADAKTSKGKTPDERLAAGERLMKTTLAPLTQLKKALSTSDIRLQTIADKLANEILQCGIDYYNGSNDDDCAEKAMKLQRYALSIAIGQLAKDRCKENVDILQRNINSLPPASVRNEFRAVHDELRKFCDLPDKICHSITLLNATKPHLNAMKAVVGATHPAYLKLSTQVVNNALHNLIEEVNEAQEKPARYSDDRVDSLFMLMKLKTVLEEAWKGTLLMDSFDMEPAFKSNRYAENRRALKGLCDQLGVSTTSRPISTPRPIPTPQPTSSSSGDDDNTGCLLWILLAFAIFVISQIASH